MCFSRICLINLVLPYLVGKLQQVFHLVVDGVHVAFVICRKVGLVVFSVVGVVFAYGAFLGDAINAVDAVYPNLVTCLRDFFRYGYLYQIDA